MKNFAILNGFLRRCTLLFLGLWTALSYGGEDGTYEEEISIEEIKHIVGGILARVSGEFAGAKRGYMCTLLQGVEKQVFDCKSDSWFSNWFCGREHSQRKVQIGHTATFGGGSIGGAIVRHSVPEKKRMYCGATLWCIENKISPTVDLVGAVSALDFDYQEMIEDMF
ncbi:MAG: hypothetical protein LBC42_02730 [Puniceicoccales bacterium]|jgi:hypothetical protein|nr:hypothetical protein [Puniceicoccales bacterium]